MTDKMYEQAQQAIKECPWREECFTIDICKGACLPCHRVIEKGRCNTLMKLFKEVRGVVDG